MSHVLSWHILPGQGLQYRQWGQEAVLFNDLSGDTHLLDSDALAVLLALRDGAADLVSLRAALGADDDEESTAALALVLEQLAAISLIEQRA